MKLETLGFVLMAKIRDMYIIPVPFLYSSISALQQEVRKVYKSLIEEDENFEGWILGHG